MIAAYLLLNIALMAVLFWARTVLVRFLRDHGSIADEASLREFKNVARWNMYGALGFLVCSSIALLMGIALGRQYGLFGLLIVLAVSIPSLLLSLSTKKVEVQARTLECDPRLREEYERVSETWVRKALPNF